MNKRKKKFKKRLFGLYAHCDNKVAATVLSYIATLLAARWPSGIRIGLVAETSRVRFRVQPASLVVSLGKTLNAACLSG